MVSCTTMSSRAGSSGTIFVSLPKQASGSVEFGDDGRSDEVCTALGNREPRSSDERPRTGEVRQVKSSRGNHIFPPLQVAAKAQHYPTSAVIGIHSWWSTSRLAWKRSGVQLGARTTSEGLQHAQMAPFAAGNGFHKVSVGLADLTESSTATPVNWGFAWS